jgi:hypothetical protein
MTFLDRLKGAMLGLKFGHAKLSELVYKAECNEKWPPQLVAEIIWEAEQHPVEVLKYKDN